MNAGKFFFSRKFCRRAGLRYANEYTFLTQVVGGPLPPVELRLSGPARLEMKRKQYSHISLSTHDRTPEGSLFSYVSGRTRSMGIPRSTSVSSSWLWFLSRLVGLY